MNIQILKLLLCFSQLVFIYVSIMFSQEPKLFVGSG